MILNILKKLKIIIYDCQKPYFCLISELKANILNFEDIFLKSEKILTDDDSVMLNYYFYSTTSALNEIREKKHLCDKFRKITLQTLNKDRDKFIDIRSKITKQISPYIDLLEKPYS